MTLKQPIDQHRAAVEGAAFVEPFARDSIELTGTDRATFLHNFCTQEIKRLPAGSGAEAFLTNIKGRLLGHVLVFAAEQSLWLDGPPGSAAKLIPHLDRYLITEVVQIRDRTADLGEISVFGPAAAEIVDTVIPGAGALAPFQHRQADGVCIRRFSFTRQPGWLLGASQSDLPLLRERLRAAGAVHCTPEVFEALRIEAGYPQYGVDLTEDHLAQEAGRTKQAISFTKGCYLGQEPIARLDALGHTNRELRGIRLAEAVAAPAGTTVFLPESDTVVGTLSSASVLPLDGHVVALAMLRREACEPGTAVEVQLGHARQRGTVYWT